MYNIFLLTTPLKFTLTILFVGKFAVNRMCFLYKNKPIPIFPVTQLPGLTIKGEIAILQ